MGTVNKRLDWVDVYKGIAILFVIVGHSIRFDMRSNIAYDVVFKLIYAVHMPIFFAVSGYLFGRQSLLKAVNLKDFFKKKIHGILKPFFTYSIIIYFIFFVASLIPGIGKVLSSAGIQIYGFGQYMVLNLLGENPYADHLWYLWVLFLMQILSILIISLAKKKKFNPFICCLAVAFVLWSCRMLWVDGTYDAIMKFFRYLIFFVIGMKLPDIKIKLPKITKMFIYLLSIAYCIWHVLFRNVSSEKLVNYFFNIIHTFSIVIIILLLIRLSEKISSSAVLQYLGKNSLAVYMFHQPFFCAFLGLILYNKLNLPSIFACVTTTLASVIVPAIIIESAKRVTFIQKALDCLFSVKPF